jgi:hypothetical protein
VGRRRPDGDHVTESIESDLQHSDGDSDRHQDQSRPVYQKPILRKYDQIEQVKPYGPSELEAG